MACLPREPLATQGLTTPIRPCREKITTPMKQQADDDQMVFGPASDHRFQDGQQHAAIERADQCADAAEDDGDDGVAEVEKNRSSGDTKPRSIG